MTQSDMTPSATESKIRRLSIFLGWAITVIAVLLPIFTWGMWLLPDLSGITRTAAPADGFGGGDLSWFGLPIRLGAAGIATIGLAITVYGFFHLRTLFREAARGAYFSAQAVIGFRQFALASLIAAIWSPVEHIVLGVFLSVSNPNVPNALNVTLGSGDLEAIGAALLFFLIAFILAEGRKRTEELELIL
ncbi:DUF2975 domain-containing protein [Maricaulis sp.]|uniref:DUF2975 domain-containing protein n=1 Tax=Maricaulis sp. TaxID=1486257 RepID=UPI002630B27E|nr:DUF2975 domain-containing protein [Maricaulis sp.]MDF1768175.1 DUF2975 domain-containing protein [Maricaulis sp.]